MKYLLTCLSGIVLLGALEVSAQEAAGESIDDVLVRFAVLALDTEHDTRVVFEDTLVKELQNNNFDAVASHTVIPDFDNVRNPELRQSLLEHGINIALILRPIAVGGDASLESMSEYMTPDNYSTIRNFVQSYRGDNLSSDVVVQVAVFIFNENTSMNFWHGMIWLDEEVDSQADGIQKLVDLVIFNANQQRPLMRQRLGLPQLSE